VADPTKGSKLYLAAKEEKEKEQEPGSEQSVRRQLRHLNWIARTIVKKYANREAAFSIDDMNKVIAELLERYQTKVLGWEKADKANTGYEVRVIGNMLLPPTKRNPQGKSVLMSPGMDPNATVEDAIKPVPQKKKDRITNKVIKLPPVTAVDLVGRFNEICDIADELFDPDLRATIKQIVAAGKIEAKEPEVAATATPIEAPVTAGVTPEIPVGEAIEGEEVIPGAEAAPIDPSMERVKAAGLTIRDILRDDRIKNVFSPKAVKQAIKGMINTGDLKIEPDGSIIIGSAVGQPSPLAQSIRASGAKKAEELEKIKDAEEFIAQSEEEEGEAKGSEEGEEIVSDDPEKAMHSPPEKKPDWWGDETFDEPAETKEEEEEGEKKVEPPEEESSEEKAEKEEEEEALKRYGFKK